MYVLDTNTLIYFFKGIGKVAEKLLSIAPKDIGLPAIALFEILVGIEKSTAAEKRRQQLEQLANIVNILPFGHKEAKYAAEIRANLEARGRPIGPYDILIAATAISNNSPLITHNVKEFSRIEGLQIEDWY
jgi:tRNA(fMet)-specific endonuclease VapC